MQGVNRDVRALAKVAKRQGWTVGRTKGGRHVRFCPPSRSGAIVVGPATPSDWRAVKNLRAQLRRSGLEV